MKIYEQFDILIVGSGIAGLFYALKLVEHDKSLKIAVVTKKGTTDSITNRAQGGIAAVLAGTDSVESHIEDTVKTGCGLCHLEVAEKIVELGPKVIEELVSYGVNFSMKDGQYDLTREGGHSANRVLHAGDLTGREVERAVSEAVRQYSENIRIYENHLVIDLITGKNIDREICSGAIVFDSQKKEIKIFSSKITMLASGGIGQIYLYNTNPPIATGDGVAIAYRAGVSIANMEFIQFHPTSLYSPGKKSFLISEAVRGEGGRIRSIEGAYLMEKAHPLKDLAPRDIVAREIDKELKFSGKDFVYLDLSIMAPEFIKKRFPNIYKECLKRGIDITANQIPVVPAAHYSCGGILSELNGETELPGLYVAGETAMTGLHGANRLASNSLLEAVVMAKLAAKKSIQYLKEISFSDLKTDESLKYLSNKPIPAKIIAHNRKLLRQIMSDYVGIVRTEKLLINAGENLTKIQQEIDYYFSHTLIDYSLVELRNMITVSQLVVSSALERKESRGLHFVEEYPQLKKKFEKDTIIKGYRRKKLEV